jgi:hypothetical protein
MLTEPSLTTSSDPIPRIESDLLNGQGAIHTQAKPLVIELDEEAIATLDPLTRNCVEGIAALAGQRLTEWVAFEVELPATALEGDSAVLSMNDLFKTPGDGELLNLVQDENGDFLPLTDEQFAQIRRTGHFEIESQDFPGQKHVWRVSPLLQKGAEHIQDSHEGHLATIFDQVAIQIPERLSADGSISVGRGAKNIYYGLRAFPAFFIGLPETCRSFDDFEVGHKVKAARQEEILQLVSEHHKGDPRLVDKELSESLVPILKEMESAWMSYRLEKRNEWMHVIEEQHPGENWRFREQKLELREKREYPHFIETYQPLEDVSEGLAKLIADVERASAAAKNMEADYGSAVDKFVADKREEIKQAHSIRARSSGWLDKQVRKAQQDFEREEVWTQLSSKGEQLKLAGFELESKAYLLASEFKKEREPALRTALESQKVASRTFDIQKKIWFSQNYQAVESKNGDSIYYTTKRHEESEVSTDQWFWRLRLVGAQSSANINNGLRTVLIDNLWNGPVGLRSLLGAKPFCADQKIDRDTGELVDDRDTLTYTLVSRCHGLWHSVEKARLEFEEQPDSGILPKDFSRGLHRFYQYGIRGGMGTAALVVGQPLVTAANVLVSSVAAVTAPIWGAFNPVTNYVEAPLIYDRNSPGLSENGRVRVWFPIVGHIVSDILVRGIGQTTLALAGAAVGHPLAAVGTGMYAELQKWTRTAYDFTVANLLIRHGRQPAIDTWLNTRVQGPGLSNDYFFQLKPEIALLALQVELEKAELMLLDRSARKTIRQPSKDFRDFFNELVGSLGTMDLEGNKTLNRLNAVESERIKAHRTVVDARRKALREASSIDADRRSIRQTAADLEATLKMGEELVRSFYEQRLVPVLDEEGEAAFWRAENLKAGDFAGLAKVYFGRIFSADFMEPLEVTDEHLVIEVSDPSAKKFLETLMHPEC